MGVKITPIHYIAYTSLPICYFDNFSDMEHWLSNSNLSVSSDNMCCGVFFFLVQMCCGVISSNFTKKKSYIAYTN